MAQLYQCTNHEFIENNFDVPMNDRFDVLNRLQLVKKTPRREYCKHCELTRNPIYKDGEFVYWNYEYGEEQ